MQFIFRHPKSKAIQNPFLEPFSDIAWYCMLALIIVIIGLVGIIVVFEYKVYKLATSINLSTFDFECRPDFVILTVMEAVLMQGPSPALFRRVSSRMVILIMSLVAFVLMQFYNGFLVSSLISEPRRTLTDLNSLYNSDFEMGIENISFNLNVLRNTTHPVLRNIYQNRIQSNITTKILSAPECIKRILAGGFAGHVQVVPVLKALRGKWIKLILN